MSDQDDVTPVAAEEEITAQDKSELAEAELDKVSGGAKREA